MLFLRTSDSTGRLKADTRARLQIRRMRFFHQDSLAYQVSVLAAGRTARLTTLDLTVPEDGELRVPVLCENKQATITIINDTARPAWITGAEWEGEFHARNALR